MHKQLTFSPWQYPMPRRVSRLLLLYYFAKYRHSKRTLRLTRASFAAFSLGGDARKVSEYHIAALCRLLVGRCRLGVVLRVVTSRARDCNGYPAGPPARGVEVEGPVRARRAPACLQKNICMAWVYAACLQI